LRGRAIAGSRCLHDEYVFVTINDLLSMRGELTTIFNYEKLHIIFNSSRPAATPHARVGETAGQRRVRHRHDGQ